MPELKAFQISQLIYLLPELIIVFGIVIVILLDLIFKNSNKLLFAISILVCVLSIYLIVINPTSFKPLFYLALNPNESSHIPRVLADISLIFILILWFSKDKKDANSPEFLYLWLIKLFFVHLLCLSNHWLIVVLSIEGISLSSYVLIARSYSRPAYESAFKYLVFGALSTGIMLFGISLLFVSKGDLYFSSLNFFYNEFSLEFNLLNIGILFSFTGIIFKLGLVPLHFWAPDVYEGSDYPFLISLSTLPKIGVFGFFISQFLIQWKDGEFSLSVFSDFIAIIALISIIWGNLSALRQTSFNRLFAYSAIAQSGFITLALLPGYLNFVNLYVYLGIYVSMQVIVFGSAQLINKESLNLKDFSGMGKNYVLISIIITIAMMALIGLPPTGGFTAKFVVLNGVFEWYSNLNTSFRLIIFLAAVINVVISLFYYIRIPYFMYFKEGNQTLIPKLSLKTLLAINTIILLLSFFFFDYYKTLISMNF